jgi:hypothetical protein
MKSKYGSRSWNPKRQGETAQLLFRAHAAEHGFSVLDPYGDSKPYDVAIQYEDGPILRIQVKSTYKPRVDGSYGFHLRGGRGKQAYTSKQIDFLGAYIFPEKCWYLIPVRALHRCGARLKTLKINHAGKQENKWIAFQNAWKELTGSRCGHVDATTPGCGTIPQMAKCDTPAIG